MAVEEVILLTEGGLETLGPMIPLERAEGEPALRGPGRLEAVVKKR